MVPDTHAQFLSKGLTRWLMILIFAVVLVLAGCNKKKVVSAPPPPPPPPASPTATLNASPDAIKAGESSTLTWQTQNATDITLDGQAVDANGSKTVTPGESITFRLIAKGPGGTEEAAVRITVTQLPPPPPAAGPGDEELFAQNIKHIYFDYDKYDIRPDQQPTLEANAQWLAKHPNVSFTIQGHCDERGSAEYNVALGDNRANAVKTALIQAGVSTDRIRTISYGKEKPFCTDANEACWQQNRRGYFAYGK